MYNEIAMLKINIVFAQLVIVVEGGDSCRRSVTGETPQTQSVEEAHRTPCGKRPPEAEINSPL